MRLKRETRHALLSTIFLFSFLTWLYVVTLQVTHPAWLSAPLTHIDIFPFNLRVDITGIIAFIISALAFFLWQQTPTRSKK
jgi:hypothetical protein